MTVIDTTMREPAVKTPPVPPIRRNGWLVPVVIAGYVLIGMAAFWPVLPWSSQRLFGVAGDSVLAMWFLAWVPHALSHGLNPLFSNAIFVPTGVNLAQNTEAPFLGLLTVPLAPILGPVARANLLMVLAMPISATAAFVVLRKWKVWGPAAALGGLIYGFSPYEVGEGLGHLVLAFGPFPPFIALTVASILQRRGSPLRLGIQLGLLLAAQFLSEPEIFTTVVILIAWTIVILMVRYPRKVSEVARAMLRPVGSALAVMVVLLAYPIWMMLDGPQHYVGTAQPIANPYYNDLFSFVTPGSLQKFSLGIPSLGLGLSNPSEIGGFIGIPLVVIALALIWRSRRSPRMQLAVVILLGAATLSLGPHLAIDGRLTRVPLPFLVLDHLPLFSNILPVRLSLEVDACLAAVIAFGLDDMHRTPVVAHRHSPTVHQRRAAVLAVVIFAMLVATQLPKWPYQSQTVRVLPTQIRRAVPVGDPVAITYPFASPVFPQPMLWQAEDGFAFRLFGGYAEHPDSTGKPWGFPNLMKSPDLELFLEGQEHYNRYLPYVPINPALVAQVREALSSNDIRLVVVDRSVNGSGAVVDLFTRVLGQPEVSNGSFALWASSHGSL